uniref:Ephrin RBD domain-containing protein n=1 Tax=Parascaris equorum TaxID=6256 RepID=A0A914R9M4_PAREQ
MVRIIHRTRENEKALKESLLTSLLMAYSFRDTQHEPADIDAEKMDSLVSRFGYENCALDETAKVVGRCADPYVPLTIRTVFRQFTPLPSGLE